MDNKEFFASQGLKNTKHRNMVYDILKCSEQPLTSEELFLRLKVVDASICYSTVYRILDAFFEKGLVLKSSIGGENKAVFELNRAEHRHRLICIGCRRMIALEDCPLDQYEKNLESKTHFDITAHKLEIFGYCPECKDKE